MNIRRFLRRSTFSLALAGGLTLSAQQVPPAAEFQAAAAQRQDVFKAVTSELDTNGDVLMFFNTSDLLKIASDSLLETLNAIPANQNPNSTPVTPAEYVRRTSAFFEQAGLNDLQGLGFSSSPRADGFTDFKMFVARPASAMEKPLWKLGGTIPTGPLQSLRYQPKDTVLLGAGNLDLAELWKMVQDGVQQIGGNEASMQLVDGVQKVNQMTGVDLDALLKSMGDELFFSVQLAEDANITMPMGDKNLEFPQPSVLLGLKLKSPEVATATLESFVTKNQLVKVTVDGAEFVTTPGPLPLPLPMSVQPTFCIQDGFLFFSLSNESLSRALATAKSGDGLEQTAAFKAMATDAPKAYNSIEFVHERFQKTIADIQKSTASGGEAVMVSTIQKAFGNKQSLSFSVVKPTGMLSSGVTSQSVKKLTAAMATLPAVWFIAMDAQMKAMQGEAGMNGCINNLRQLDSAKQQWAIETNQPEDAVPPMSDLQEYLREPLTCPEGGTYTIGPVSANPTCTIPGHQLPGMDDL